MPHSVQREIHTWTKADRRKEKVPRKVRFAKSSAPLNTCRSLFSVARGSPALPPPTPPRAPRRYPVLADSGHPPPSRPPPVAAPSTLPVRSARSRAQVPARRAEDAMRTRKVDARGIFVIEDRAVVPGEPSFVCAEGATMKKRWFRDAASGRALATRPAALGRFARSPAIERRAHPRGRRGVGVSRMRGGKARRQGGPVDRPRRRESGTHRRRRPSRRGREPPARARRSDPSFFRDGEYPKLQRCDPNSHCDRPRRARGALRRSG